MFGKNALFKDTNKQHFPHENNGKEKQTVIRSVDSCELTPLSFPHVFYEQAFIPSFCVL